MTAVLGRAMMEEVTKKMIPAKRIGQPEEMADAVLFFASPTPAASITGQVLAVDGGFTV